MPRYIVTRVVRDRSVPRRYRRSGWWVFDIKHENHGLVWPTRREAQADADHRNTPIREEETR